MSDRFCGRSDWLVNPGSADAMRDAKPGPAIGSPRAKVAMCDWITQNYAGGWVAVLPLPDACARLAECAEWLPGALGAAAGLRGLLVRL